MTNSWNTPVEALEYQFPLRVSAYSVRRGSGGSGRHRGGDGIVREYEFLEPAKVTLLADRRLNPPWSLQGGSPGTPGRDSLVNKKQLAAKGEFAVDPGDRVRIETPGGGGWGKP
jgi:N-methylhydantoinase B